MMRPDNPKRPRCSVPGCEKPVVGWGWCNTHYERWRISGSARPEEAIAAQGMALAYLDHAVKHFGPECLIWPYARNAQGYAVVMGGKLATREVCKRINGPPPTPKHEAAHSCGKGHEGCISGAHLRWATHTENEADKKLHGTFETSRAHLAKLTREDFEQIRSLRGAVPQVELARRFGVTPTTISRVINHGMTIFARSR